MKRNYHVVDAEGPWINLPKELKNRIFILTLIMNVMTFGYKCYDHVLASVCKEWRKWYEEYSSPCNVKPPMYRSAPDDLYYYDPKCKEDIQLLPSSYLIYEFEERLFMLQWMPAVIVCTSNRITSPDDPVSRTSQVIGSMYWIVPRRLVVRLLSFPDNYYLNGQRVIKKIVDLDALRSSSASESDTDQTDPSYGEEIIPSFMSENNLQFTPAPRTCDQKVEDYYTWPFEFLKTSEPGLGAFLIECQCKHDLSTAAVAAGMRSDFINRSIPTRYRMHSKHTEIDQMQARITGTHAEPLHVEPAHVEPLHAPLPIPIKMVEIYSINPDKYNAGILKVTK